jgi:hypothetical protein
MKILLIGVRSSGGTNGHNEDKWLFVIVLWTRLKRFSRDSEAYFVYYPLLFFFPQTLKETYISRLSEALYLSGRSNWNFTTEHFKKSVLTN